jgi:hypothetical protein
MMRLTEVKAGDIVVADFEGQKRVGDVLEVSRGDKKALVAHGENEFWYNMTDLYAVPLDGEILTELGFAKVDNPTNGMSYERGPFTLQYVHTDVDVYNLLHYRDETRHVHNMQYLHQLQHHYKAMTNHELTWP